MHFVTDTLNLLRFQFFKQSWGVLSIKNKVSLMGAAFLWSCGQFGVCGS